MAALATRAMGAALAGVATGVPTAAALGSVASAHPTGSAMAGHTGPGIRVRATELTATAAATLAPDSAVDSPTASYSYPPQPLATLGGLQKKQRRASWPAAAFFACVM